MAKAITPKQAAEHNADLALENEISFASEVDPEGAIYPDTSNKVLHFTRSKETSGLYDLSQ